MATAIVLVEGDARCFHSPTAVDEEDVDDAAFFQIGFRCTK